MARICVDQRLFATACGLCLCVALASTAVGDGGFLPPIDYSGQDLTEPSQRAVLVHWEGRESLFLFVDYHGAADKFAWIIPCPTKPDVRTASVNVLTEAAKYYHHLERLTWQEELSRRGLSDGDMGGGGQRPEDEDVRIHVIKQVGPYEIAIVSATEGEPLAAWLNENGYAISPRAAPILKEYIDQHWFFAAVKVRAAAGRLQTLPPIVLRFQTDTPI